jgi:pimeloyl-ACP methyl ester carboxylesterase
MIIALLDSLELYKVNAIGASSGGTTLFYLNTSQPERFKSVITVGGHIYYSKQGREWIENFGMKQFMEWAEYHGPEKQEYLAKAFWDERKLSDGDPSFTPDKLNTISAKWLVVNGDNDQAVPMQLALEIHKSIPNSWLWIVPKGGHTPHLNTDFQSEFIRVSFEFLNGNWD